MKEKQKKTKGSLVSNEGFPLILNTILGENKHCYIALSINEMPET